MDKKFPKKNNVKLRIQPDRKNMSHEHQTLKQ